MSGGGVLVDPLLTTRTRRTNTKTRGKDMQIKIISTKLAAAIAPLALTAAIMAPTATAAPASGHGTNSPGWLSGN
jgi:hypothetical protein